VLSVDIYVRYDIVMYWLIPARRYSRKATTAMTPTRMMNRRTASVIVADW